MKHLRFCELPLFLKAKVDPEARIAYRLVKRIQQSRKRIAQASILISLPIWVSIFPAEVDSHPRSNASATYYHSSPSRTTHSLPKKKGLSAT